MTGIPNRTLEGATDPPPTNGLEALGNMTVESPTAPSKGGEGFDGRPQPGTSDSTSSHSRVRRTLPATTDALPGDPAFPEGAEPTPACTHHPAPPGRTVWLKPLNREANTNPVLLHGWCLECGAVRNEGGDRPKRIGYFVNVLGRLSRWLERERRRGVGVPLITEVQKRLIVEDLINDERFVDMFDVTRAIQVEAFYENVERRLGRTPRVLVERALEG